MEEVEDFLLVTDRLTLDRLHFVRLHKQTFQHGRIIVCTFDPDFFGQAARRRFHSRQIPHTTTWVAGLPSQSVRIGPVTDGRELD